MIPHPWLEMPGADRLIKRIADATRSQAGFWADAAAVTQDLFGSTTTANFFVVGMAVQAGCLPIDPARVEEAVRLNGVSVESNLAAFRWGRAQIADPDALEGARRAARTTAGATPALGAVARRASSGAVRRIESLAGPGSPLALDLERYAAELEAFGGVLLGGASRSRPIAIWLDVLDRVARAERAIVAAGGPGSDALVAAVAAALFKLLAYKDEYEVARLMTDADGTGAAREVAGSRGRIAWRLHPPILRAMGLTRKIAIGAWATPLVRVLARLRFLRGTPFDPFGYAEVRRQERQLPREYVAVLDRILPHLTRENLAGAIALAELPDRVRGYEQIKLAQIAGYRDAIARAESELVPPRAGD